MKVLIIIFFLLILSCQDNSQTVNNRCSNTNTHGDCPNNQSCINGECVPIETVCSPENLDGKCSDGELCLNGECIIGEYPCSVEHVDGACNSGTICIDGECIDENGVCSNNNLEGVCPQGEKCENGVCIENNSEPECSEQYPEGKCPDLQICLDGECVFESLLCSDDKPDGLCSEGYYCNEGECIEIPCEDGDLRGCYPMNRSQIGVGICQQGYQVCIDKNWKNCSGAITPQEEVCDNIDNDCDGLIDEGVKNRCGLCGEVPEEIVGNHIDDDCDGLIDEDQNDQGGMENCDGRTHQPCYTGPIETSGKGECQGGFRDCLEDNTWGECIGEVKPTNEICHDGKDNDCDGLIDEYCETQNCLDEEICDNRVDDNCNNLIDEGCIIIERDECEENEICGDGFDNNCDGVVDENCQCSDNTNECYLGDPSDIIGGNSICKKGTMSCIGGEYWSVCNGSVTPEYEICDGIDNDCDGLVDEDALDANSCGVCGETPPAEICHDEIDNDCDGLIDENCPVFCVAEEEICDGADNDCDGLIDEGVLNACGTCGESCYEEDITGEDDFNQGDFDGVSNGDNPDEITLDSAQIQNNFIWIANSGEGTVSKINTITGEVFGPFPVGSSPSRTAVDLDGSVWVANRNSHNVTRLDSNGNHICTVNLHTSCAPRGVAIDKNRDVWIGCGNWINVAPDGWIYKIKLLNAPTNPDDPNSICQIVPLGDSGDDDGGLAFKGNAPYMIYGMAIDYNGNLWTSPGTAASSYRYIAKINTNLDPSNSGFLEHWLMNSHQYYGIVIDGNNDVWYGLWSNSSKSQAIARVKYIDANTPLQETLFPAQEATASSLSNGRGIAVDAEGNIWAAYSGSDRVVKFDSEGNFIADYPSYGTTPIGVGVDSDGEIWVNNNGSNNVTELSSDGSTHTTYSVGSNPYTYSDMTGFNLRHFVSPGGTFRTIVDTERVDAQYDSIEWDGTTPNGSVIKARVRIANSESSFQLPDGDPSAPLWSEWIINSGDPIVWPQNAQQIGRYIQIEMKLEIGDTENDKPVLRGVYVNWQRP